MALQDDICSVMEHTKSSLTSAKMFFVLVAAVLLPGSLFAADITLAWDANTETDLAGYRLYYGTSSRSYGSPISVGTTTTYTMQNLSPGTYFFTVTAYNTSGAESGYSNEVSTIIGQTDTTPPVISAVSPGGATRSGATITWTTNELADSQVDYGTTPNYGYTTALNSTLVTSHTQALTALIPGTFYYFRVKSKDAAATLSSSSGTFSTMSQSCLSSVSPTIQTFTQAGGSNAVSVTVSGVCSWTAVSNAVWISLTAGTSGLGNGTVSYSVAANVTGASRSGSLTIAGQTVTVNQAGPASCDLNGDGFANVIDIQVIINVILGTIPNPGNADLNRDGRVDVLDLQYLSNVVLGVRSCS
jgi:hypothetical protein